MAVKYGCSRSLRQAGKLLFARGRSRIPRLRFALIESRLDARRDRRSGCSFREPTKVPPDFGLRQSSGAFRFGMEAQKRQGTAAVQDTIATAHPPPRFTVPMHAQIQKGALHDSAH